MVLVTCVIAAFWPMLHAGFIWDDDSYVTNNLTLRSLDGLRRIWLQRAAVRQYYPLVHSSFWLEYHVWGLNPLGYHLVNVLLHSVNALLVWRLLDRLGVPGAYLAGLIFAVHPMQVESVAWVTERKNVLSGFFYLLALGAYLRVMRLDDTDTSRRPSLRIEIIALILFACALLSKTVTVTLPGVIVLLIMWKRGRVERHELVGLAGPLAFGLILSLQTAIMEKVDVGAAGKEWDLSFAEHVLVAGRALWFYLGKLVWPRDVLFMYPRWTPDPSQWWQWCFPVAAVLVGVLLFAWRRSIGSGPFVAALYYAGTLVPALGFFSVYPMRYSFVANHFAYLATIGPIALAASAGVRFAARSPGARRESLYVGAVALILMLVFLSHSEARNYRDLKTLWVSTIARNPDCVMCHNNLGRILASAGRTSEAKVQFEEALRLKPDHAEAHVNLGNVLANEGRTSEAIAHYGEALRLKPDLAEAHNNLGLALANAGRAPEAIAQYEEALRLKPDSAEIHVNLGNAFAKTGRKLGAIAHFERALRLKADLAGGPLPEMIAQLKDALVLEEPRRRNGPSGEAGGAR
jgi:tetratricopeptide (TPR) repeat protein